MYKIGKKVTVRLDLADGGDFEPVGICPDMIKFRGKVVTIEDYVSYKNATGYHLKEDPDKWFWLDEMFQELPKSPYELYSEFVPTEA